MKSLLQAMYNYMKGRLYIIFLLVLLFSSCSKDEIVCGVVEDGRIGLSGLPYLQVDGREYWVSEFTYNSAVIGQEICLDDW